MAKNKKSSPDWEGTYYNPYENTDNNYKYDEYQLPKQPTDDKVKVETKEVERDIPAPEPEEAPYEPPEEEIEIETRTTTYVQPVTEVIEP